MPTVATSRPIIGDPLNRGAIVSKFIVDRRGNVLTGDRAYDSVVYAERTLLAGFTTVRNLGDGFNTSIALRRAVAE